MTQAPGLITAALAPAEPATRSAAGAPTHASPLDKIGPASQKNAPVASTDFADRLKAAAPTPGAVRTPPNTPVVRANATDPQIQLLALLMQNFVSEMLPEQSDQLHGGGTAGRAWRAQLSEALADTLVKSGTFDTMLGSRAPAITTDREHHQKQTIASEHSNE
jgi:hypothetical protein